MQLKFEEDELIKINRLKNIESIDITDLYVTRNSKLIIIPCITTFYDGGKVIQLCSKDKYFYFFVQKLREVYKDEKNNVYENNLLDPFMLRKNIVISDETEKILNSESLLNINELYKFYDQKKSYSQSFIYQKEDINLLFPIIKYHLINLLDLTDVKLNLKNLIEGYRNHYTISGSLNNEERIFPIIYKKITEDEFIVTVGGVFSNTVPINIRIKFNLDKIVVKMTVEDKGLYANYEYKIVDGLVKNIEDVTKDNICIHYSNKDLVEQDNIYNNIVQFDGQKTLKYYKLPWEAYYGSNVDIQNLSTNDKKISNYNLYIGVFNNSFLRKEYYSLTYLKKTSSDISYDKIILEDYRQQVKGVLRDNNKKIYLIETLFYDSLHSESYYLTNLSNKYFYHLVSSRLGIKGVELKDLITLSRHDVIYKEDVLNKQLLRKLTGRE